jgi:ABC-type oligopeptide transport system substrate-binding subunit
MIWADRWLPCLQQQLLVGIQMDIRPMNCDVLFRCRKGNFQMYSLRWIGGNNDPDILNFVSFDDVPAQRR